jgi:hypothetical protein
MDISVLHRRSDLINPPGSPNIAMVVRITNALQVSPDVLRDREQPTSHRPATSMVLPSCGTVLHTRAAYVYAFTRVKAVTAASCIAHRSASGTELRLKLETGEPLEILRLPLRFRPDAQR